ncbi:hypothetical protein E4U60_001361 [Claviceps pazoutovae]|uniref:Uncharacterized protein n=1 Tax=Claviceps pazoutovae TaxID=1649127 RepID=A0A9P7MD17_9HYPO|nr:hypothetical protein E4U60_001361 [Claviceps pazoutovae]
MTKQLRPTYKFNLRAYKETDPYNVDKDVGTGKVGGDGATTPSVLSAPLTIPNVLLDQLAFGDDVYIRGPDAEPPIAITPDEAAAPTPSEAPAPPKRRRGRLRKHLAPR